MLVRGGDPVDVIVVSAVVSKLMQNVCAVEQDVGSQYRSVWYPKDLKQCDDLGAKKERILRY